MNTVVIIDDEPLARTLLKEYLEEFNELEIVDECGDGFEGVKAIALHKPDLIFLDVQMPKLNGLEVLKLLREEDNDVSVIPITAVNDNKTISEFLNLGVVDYLVKPFSQERFNQAVYRCELKYKMFQENGKLSQKEIDQMFNTSSDSNLPKGLQENTLSYITTILNDHKKELLDVEEISLITNLSKVSLRKYLDYLTEINVIDKRIDYGTVGRPKYKYYIK